MLVSPVHIHELVPTTVVHTANLAAARVSVAADPSLAPPIVGQSNALPLYTMAADRIEVATEIARGLLIDQRA